MGIGRHDSNTMKTGKRAPCTLSIFFWETNLSSERGRQRGLSNPPGRLDVTSYARAGMAAESQNAKAWRISFPCMACTILNHNANNLSQLYTNLCTQKSSCSKTLLDDRGPGQHVMSPLALWLSLSQIISMTAFSHCLNESDT